jgi:hypothetical protein
MAQILTLQSQWFYEVWPHSVFDVRFWLCNLNCSTESDSIVSMISQILTLQSELFCVVCLHSVYDVTDFDSAGQWFCWVRLHSADDATESDSLNDSIESAFKVSTMWKILTPAVSIIPWSLLPQCQWHCGASTQLYHCYLDIRYSTVPTTPWHFAPDASEVGLCSVTDTSAKNCKSENCSEYAVIFKNILEFALYTWHELPLFWTHRSHKLEEDKKKNRIKNLFALSFYTSNKPAYFCKDCTCIRAIEFEPSAMNPLNTYAASLPYISWEYSRTVYSCDQLGVSWESADLRKRVPLPTDLARGISPPADSGFRDSLLCGRAKIILTIYSTCWKRSGIRISMRLGIKHQ